MTVRTERGRTFRNHASVELGTARTKKVHLPFVSGPVVMGLHGEVAAHYRVEQGSYVEHATTLDYLVGAAVACLTGTFGGLLVPLGQSLDDGQLRADGTGEIENSQGVLLLRRIDVTYRLRTSRDIDLDQVRRVHDRHTALCPLARSVGGSIGITTRLALQTRD